MMIVEQESEIRKILTSGSRLQMGNIYPRLETRIIRIFYEYVQQNDIQLDDKGSLQLKKTVVDVLLFHINNCYNNIERFDSLELEFNYQFNKSQDDVSRKEAILEFARKIGRSPVDLRGDKKAFQRWFGYDAVVERCHRQKSLWEYDIHYCLGRWGAICQLILSQIKNEEDVILFFSISRSMDWILKSILHRGDERVKAMALEALYQALQLVSPDIRREVVPSEIQNTLYKTALNLEEDVWCQKWAFYVLSLFENEIFLRTARKRLEDQSLNDGIFVRKAIAEIFFDRFHQDPANNYLLESLLKDSSSHVRQGCCELLADLQDDNAFALLATICLNDNDIKVRAKTILLVPDALHEQFVGKSYSLYAEILQSTKLPQLILKATFHSIESLIHKYYTQSLKSEANNLAANACSWIQKMKPALENPDHRILFNKFERFRLFSQGELYKAYKQLLTHIESVKQRERLSIAANDLSINSQKEFGRICSVICQDDFPLQFTQTQKGWEIIRGDQFKRKFWRFFYEWKIPSPDKRQAFRHTVARKFAYTSIAPSAILSELSQTKVPGEPLNYGKIQSWKPELPLVDEILSMLDDKWNQNTLTRFHCYGYTIIEKPKGVLATTVALMKLNFSFDQYSSLRNQSLQDDVPYLNTEYIQELEKLGFQFKHHSYEELGT